MRERGKERKGEGGRGRWRESEREGGREKERGRVGVPGFRHKFFFRFPV